MTRRPLIAVIYRTRRARIKTHHSARMPVAIYLCISDLDDLLAEKPPDDLRGGANWDYSPIPDPFGPQLHGVPLLTDGRLAPGRIAIQWHTTSTPEEYPVD